MCSFRGWLAAGVSGETSRRRWGLKATSAG